MGAHSENHNRLATIHSIIIIGCRNNVSNEIWCPNICEISLFNNQPIFYMIIPTEHGWIVDAEGTRHCVTSRYTGTEPNDANRTCQTNRHKVIIKKKIHK